MKKTNSSSPRAGLAAFLFLAIAAHVPAATINSTWSGGATGDWSVPGNWNPAAVPDNGVDLYNVNVPSPSAVTANGTFTIQILDVDAGASVIIPPGQILILNADGTVDGLLSLGATGNFNASRLRFGTDLTLGGAGTAELRGVTVFDSPAGARLTVGAGFTVRSLNANAGFELALTVNGTLLFEDNNNVINHPDGLFTTGSTGIVRASDTARVDIGPSNNGFTLRNAGLWDANNGHFVFNFVVPVTNTGTFRVRNGGSVLFTGDIDNTGGIIDLESGGRLIPSNPSQMMTITGGAITGPGGIIDQTDGAQGTLALQGGVGNDAMDISDISATIGSGRTLKLAGDFDFTAFTVTPQPGGNVQISGNVDIDGTGTLPLRLNGATGNDTLTLEPGITLLAPAGAAGSLTVKTVTTPGAVDVDSSDFLLASGSTLNTSGIFHAFPNTVFRSDGTLALSGTANLDAGSRLTGGLSFNGATVNGPGVARPTTLGLAGTSVVNTAIETAAATVTVTGAAVVNGTGKLSVNQGSSGTTTLTAAAPGATLVTGRDVDFEVTSGHTFTTDLPWQFQGEGDVTGGVLVVGADFQNDGAISLTSGARLNVNKSIVAGSTGSVTTAAGTTVNVNGASFLGGSFFGAGNIAFSGGVSVTVADYAGTGDVTVNSGANVQFSQLVASVGSLDVSDNATAAFDGGLQTLSSATANGGGVFAVTGNTTITGALNIQNSSTHGGAGTTTVQGPLEYRGQLDGRTLIAQGPTTAFQITLLNNAVFENQNDLTLLNFGTPGDTVTGIGVLRNTDHLHQSGLFGPAPNTISATFEQTATGTTTVGSELTFNGNSDIAGEVTVPANTTITFGAGATGTTHNVSGAITGGGSLKVAGNTVTGAAPTVTLSGPVNLTGADSRTEVSGGATLRVTSGPTAPTLGNEINLRNGILQIKGAAGLFVAIFDSIDSLFIGTSFDATAFVVRNATLTGSNTFDNITLAANAIFAQDVLDLKRGAQLAIEAGEAQLRDAMRIISTTGDGSVRVGNGGTLTAQGLPDDPGNPSPPVVIETPVTVVQGGAVGVQPGGTLEFSGNRVVNGGRFIIGISGLIRAVGGADLVNEVNGVINGTGTLDVSAAGSTFANEGEIAPGSSAGILTIVGNTPFAGTAKLSIEIGGATVGTQYDRLAITSGAASLDGTLSISLINSFTPAPTDSFTILTATAGVTGIFDNAATQVSFSGGMFDVSYNPGSVVLSNFAIPEPGSVFLAALGGALLLVRQPGRRRFTKP